MLDIHKVFLTFDIEDFINERSTLALQKILDILKKEDLKGIFFITGHMAEKMKSYPELVDSMKDQEIGYHSTGHSFRPLIAEYTDLPDYSQAKVVARMRETSHISPITGQPSGPGGLITLKDLFPHNSIISYRAPGFCWSPPHLEALNSLGITHDFSTCLTSDTYGYKNTVFYPFPIQLAPPEGLNFNTLSFLRCNKSVALNGTTVLLLHPSTLVNKGSWDSSFVNGNPKEMQPTNGKPAEEQEHLLKGFSSFTKRLSKLKKIGLIKVTPKLSGYKKQLKPTVSIVNQLYYRGTEWSVKNFNYQPLHLNSHFQKYFLEP